MTASRNPAVHDQQAPFKVDRFGRGDDNGRVGRQCVATSAELPEPARAISRNAVVVAVGFTPLLFAPLVPYITVGFFLATIMAVSAVVTVILLPAVMNNIRNKDALFTVNKETENA